MARIPKILHYVFGMASDFGGKPWSLMHHVCLKSAVGRIAPEQVFFYYEFEPTGPWWELSRRLVTPVEIDAPKQIFGRPLAHVAHRADVVRLQTLIEQGGIYLDADVLVQRNFDDLLDCATVLGQQGVDGRMGLANAVILAEPEAKFLCRWLEEYRTFEWSGRQDESYDEHSVRLPMRLARAHPHEITVLPHTAFYWPLWTKEHIDWIFASDKPIPGRDAYANHLWESFAWDYVEDLTPRRVRSVNTNFHMWARPLIADLPDNYGAPSLGRRFERAKKRTLRRARRVSAEARRYWIGAGRRVRRLMGARPGAA